MRRSPQMSLGRDVALATATGTAIGYTYAAHAPVLPLISRDFGLSDVQAGLISTALFLAAAATMLLIGDLADRYPTCGAVTFGMALTLAGNLASALAPSYEMLLLAKAIGGVGAGFGFIAGIRYVQRRYGDARPHFGQGFYGAGYPLGSAIGFWGMPPLALLWDWRGAFAATSGVVAIVLLPFLRATPVTPVAGRGTMLAAARCPNCRGA